MATRRDALASLAAGSVTVALGRAPAAQSQQPRIVDNAANPHLAMDETPSQHEIERKPEVFQGRDYETITV